MSAEHSVLIPPPLSAPKLQPKHSEIPQHQIRIMAWSALVILYGEPG
jgi:hypothetical protein